MTDIIKTLSLRARTKTDAATIAAFQDVAISKGLDVQKALLGMMQNFAKLNKPEFIVVSERELIERCRKLGYPTTQGTIKLHRRKGNLSDKDGNWFFTNSKGQVRYNWEKMKEFLKDRNKNPYTRIKKQ